MPRSVDLLESELARIERDTKAPTALDKRLAYPDLTADERRVDSLMRRNAGLELRGGAE